MKARLSNHGFSWCVLRAEHSQRREDVAQARAQVSESSLRAKIEEMDREHGKPLDLFERLRAEQRPMALAAEFKRASPSKGEEQQLEVVEGAAGGEGERGVWSVIELRMLGCCWSVGAGDIAPDLVAAEQAVKYASVGAAILSVLTEPKWFKGTLDDMRDVRLATGGGQGLRPAVLRKDFVIDEYQILEARAYGADTVLLIVAILEVDRLHALIKYVDRERCNVRRLGSVAMVVLGRPLIHQESMCEGLDVTARES